MWYVLLVIVHVMVSLALILVVLLQVGKGQSIGAAFGGAGSSQTFFGSRGPATFLSRLTTVSAAVFMVTSLSLAYLSLSGGQGSSIRERALPPVTDTAPPLCRRLSQRRPRRRAARQLLTLRQPLRRMCQRSRSSRQNRHNRRASGAEKAIDNGPV